MPHLTKAIYAQLTAEDSPGFDTVVIGSGLSGLTTAAILAKGAGERVLVVERHTALGGVTHESERGLEFDTGLYAVGGKVWNSGPTRRVFDYISDKRIEWARLDDVYDVAIVDGARFPIRAGADMFKLDLVKWFPGSEAAITAYFKDVEAMTAKFQGLVVNQIASGWVPKSWIRVDVAFGDETVDDALTRLGCVDKQLRQVLTYMHSAYGALSASEASWVQHCATVSHFLEGAAYPVGGPASIAQAVVPVIESRGGRCLTMATAVAILVEKGRACGVVLKGHGLVKARKVVSAVGAYSTFVTLVPEEVSQQIPDLWRARKGLEKDEPPSTSARAMAFVAFKGSQRDLGLPAANVWVNSSEPGAFASVLIAFPSCKDPNWQAQHPSTSICEIVVDVTFPDYAQWTDDDGVKTTKPHEHQRAVKAAMTERMLNVMYEHFPALKDKMDFFESSVALSSGHATAASRKALGYALKPTPARYRAAADWLKPATALPGLYLAGQDVVSCGVLGSLVGALCCASAASTLGAAASRPLMWQFSG